jgi:NitT/TauT family transport system ATP-binding protein
MNEPDLKTEAQSAADQGKLSPPSTPQEGKTREKVPSSEAQSPETAHGTNSRPHVVVFKNVTKSFGRGPQTKIALSEVSFTIEDLPDAGELVSIVGPSGCGKSTLLRMIAGLRPHFPPTSGEVTVFGKPIIEPGADRGVVDQKYSLMPHLTVINNIAFGLMLRGVSRKERCARAREWVAKVGLEGAEDKYPSELSGGMQQRVSIAATLVLEPKILLMDEPFGALDPKIRMQMQELLVQLWKEQQSTVFIVTHSVEEALYLGDRVFRMGAKPGRLVEVLHAPRPNVSPETMRKQPWFSEINQELLRRLEMDAPAAGELPGVEKWR